MIIAAGLSGCGGSAGTGSESTPSLEGSTSDAASWAGGVCSAADGLEQSLDALGASLEVDLGSDQAVVEQIGSQVQQQADNVRDEVEALTSALTDVPEDADPELAAAAEDLQADRQSLEESVAGLRDAASGLAEATDAASLARGVAAVAAQLAVVQRDAATFADAIETTAEEGATAVRAAFVDAPECDNRV